MSLCEKEISEVQLSLSIIESKVNQSIDDSSDSIRAYLCDAKSGEDIADRLTSRMDKLISEKDSTLSKYKQNLDDLTNSIKANEEKIAICSREIISLKNEVSEAEAALNSAILFKKKKEDVVNKFSVSFNYISFKNSFFLIVCVGEIV